MLGNQLGQAIVADLCELERNVGAALADGFQRRRRQRNDLRIVRELVDQAKAGVEVVDRLHRAGAPEHVLEVAANLFHLRVVLRRIEVVVGVDAHLGCLPNGLVRSLIDFALVAIHDFVALLAHPRIDLIE